jgi:hypothetical protein
MNITKPNASPNKIALAIILLISLNIHALDEVRVNSTIDKITVYQKGAQVIR